MKARTFAIAAAVLAIGYAITVALFWALLNVPESTVLALALSAVLVLFIAAAAGLTTAVAVALIDINVVKGGAFAQAGRRAIGALPGFVLGLTIFAMLWWATGSADGWWHAHSGEVDALVLRYLGTARTAPIHEGVSQTTWLLRWALGLSVVTGLVGACTLGGSRAVARGLRAAVRFVPLLATTLAALIIGKGLWRLVYWRPKLIPATWLEAAFVAAKLSVLYALAIVLAAIVLVAFQRAISRHALPARS